jgi:hypothetical protein
VHDVQALAGLEHLAGQMNDGAVARRAVGHLARRGLQLRRQFAILMCMVLICQLRTN